MHGHVLCLLFNHVHAIQYYNITFKLLNTHNANTQCYTTTYSFCNCVHLLCSFVPYLHFYWFVCRAALRIECDDNIIIGSWFQLIRHLCSLIARMLPQIIWHGWWLQLIRHLSSGCGDFTQQRQIRTPTVTMIKNRIIRTTAEGMTIRSRSFCKMPGCVQLIGGDCSELFEVDSVVVSPVRMVGVVDGVVTVSMSSSILYAVEEEHNAFSSIQCQF